MKKFVYTCLLALFGLGVQAQTDVTHYITNPDFEDGVIGWKNTGISSQSNNDFELKHGSRYAETWTGWGGTVRDLKIYQILTQLPAGVYTLTGAAKNIQQNNPNAVQKGAYLYLNNEKVEVGVPADYSVTATVTDGTLELGGMTQGATGNWVCFDNFRLTYTIVADSLQEYIKELVKRSEDIDKHMANTAQTELEEARAELAKYIGSQEVEGLDKAIKRLENAIYAYGFSAATEENPLSMPDAIINPSFEDGITGWTSDGINTQGNDVFTLKAGHYYAAKWTGRGAFLGNASRRQVLKDLPAGNYTLTCAAQNIQEDTPNKQLTGAYIYAGDNRTEVGIRATYQVKFTCVSGKIEIGFVADNAKGNWIAVDNFQLSYTGADQEAIDALMQKLIQTAEGLLVEKMNADVLAALTQAIEAAKNVTDNASMAEASNNLENAITVAEESMAAYVELLNVIEFAESVLSDKAQVGIDEFKQCITKAKALYDSSNVTNEELAQAGKELNDSVFVYQLANASGTAPKVKTHEEVIYGCKAAVGRMYANGLNIIERGFCWSENPEPTVLDNRSSFYYDFNGQVYLMDNLKPSTTYYVRAYAMNKNYAVGYGNVIKIITLPEADVVYSYNWAGDEETNARIDGACQTAVGYLNTWTAIRGYRPSVNYDAGDDGAHGSYGGWITIGAGFAQNPGTVMHEMGHGIGVGQHWRYTSWDSPLHPTMYWEGERANRVFAFFENQADVLDANGNFVSGGNHTVSDGDRVHVCYGLSGVTAPIDLLRQAAYYQGMYEDGMPAVGDGACPFHSFDCQEGVKYYLTNEGYGGGKKFLKELASGFFNYREATLEEVLSDDYYAWYVDFDPVTCFYHIRNAKSGKYLTYYNSRFLSKERPELTADDNIHLMPSRKTMTFELGGEEITVKPYWMARGNRVEEPEVLTASSSIAVSAGKLNFYDTATSQHWAFISQEQIQMATGIHEVSDEMNTEEPIEVQGYYDISGAQINQPKENGITIVRYNNGSTRKIISINK